MVHPGTADHDYGRFTRCAPAAMCIRLYHMNKPAECLCMLPWSKRACDQPHQLLQGVALLVRLSVMRQGWKTWKHDPVMRQYTHSVVAPL